MLLALALPLSAGAGDGARLAVPGAPSPRGATDFVFEDGFEPPGSPVDVPAGTLVLLGRYSSIAIGSDGRPVVSYMGSTLTSTVLRVAKCGNLRCDSGNVVTTVDASAVEVGLHTGIAIGADGLPIIRYTSRPGLDRTISVVKCGNPSCTSGNLFSTVDVQPGQNVGTLGAIAVGADGLPVISYANSSLDTLKVAKCGNAACSAGNVINTISGSAEVTASTSNSIRVPADGRPVVSYAARFGGNQELVVTKCGDASCSAGNVTTSVDAPASNVGDFNSLAIGADGLPVIAYRDAGALSVKVAKCGNAACTSGNVVTTVDDGPGSMGQDIQLAIGADGRPVIAHWDLSEREIVVIRCGNGSCTSGNQRSVFVAPVGIRELSLAIGSDGRPVLSYQDSETGTLVVARCSNASCS